MNGWGGLLLIAGVLLANLPFIPVLKAWQRSLVFLLAYGVFIALGRWMESHVSQLAPQGWAFYAVTFLLFVVAGFPAFAWRYLWHKNA
ncbi:MAG: DUF2818 family protein [Formosimonas sp.]